MEVDISSRSIEKPNEEACYESAIRLLKHRWRGREELRRRLSDKGFDPDAINAAIKRCDTEGWIDDVRFASEWARAKARRHGPGRIESDLVKLGVGRDAIEEALGSVEDLREETLQRVARKKLETLRSRKGNADLEPSVLTMKVAAFLSQRGFRAAEVHPLIDEMRRELEREDDEDS